MGPRAASTPAFIDYRARRSASSGESPTSKACSARPPPTPRPWTCRPTRRRFDPKAALGADFTELRGHTSALPGPDEGLILALTRDAALVGRLKEWVAAKHNLKELTSEA